MTTDHEAGTGYEAFPPPRYGHHQPFPPPWQPLPVPPPVQPSKGPRTALLIGASIAGAVALAAVAAIGLPAVAGSVLGVERTLTVEVDFYDSALRNISTCQGGDNGYSDIRPGMPITVRDGQNDILASSALPSTGRQQSMGRSFGCIWSVDVLVPAGEDHYVVDMGDRGSVPFTREELAANDWVAEVGIGN